MTPQIHKKSQSVLLPAAMQPFVADLPHKMVEVGGKSLVAVKHNLDTHQSLLDAGVELQHPIRLYYDMPLVGGRFTPFDHQIKTIEFLAANKRSICLNEMGLGKTASALIAADFLMQHGYTKKVLILSPLSTLDCVWASEIFHTLPHRTYNIIHGTAAKRREKLAQNCEFNIINHDGVGVVFDEIVKDKTIGLIIIDEASVYRNGSSKRYKKLKTLLQPHHWLWLMTGSPTPNAPTDAWALAKLINADTPKYFGAFKALTMNQITQFKWAPKKGSEFVVQKYLQPSIRFEKKLCLDLPPQLFEKREAELTPAQSKMFKQMRAKMEAEDGEDKLNAINAAAKFAVLRQILGGAYKSAESGTYKQIDCQPRLSAMLEVIEETPNKVIVFVPFTGMLHMVADAIAKHHSVKIIEGDTAAHDRDEIIRDFQSGKDPHVIVAAPKCLSHGVTLTEADTIIWYCPHTSADDFAQANARVDRPGQKNTTTVVLIGTHPFEWKIYEALRERLDMQKLVLDLMMNG